MKLLAHPLSTAIAFAAATGVGVTIDESTLLPIGSTAVLFGIVWWVGRKFQSIDDRLSALSKQIDTLPCCGTVECRNKDEEE